MWILTLLPLLSYASEPDKKALKFFEKAHMCTGEPAFEHIDTTTKLGTITSWRVTGCEEGTFIASYAEWRSVRSLTTDQTIRKKAPFDLDCDAASLEWTFIDSETRGVSGCGRRLSYVLANGQWHASVGMSAGKLSAPSDPDSPSPQ